MIKRILIENFQSHKQTELILHPGINIITGPSDSGKSAIRRALWWNFTNRPQGVSYVSDWNRNKAGDPVAPTAVTVEFSDGSVIRSREGSDPEKNGYQIGSKRLGAIGKGMVPEEATDLWNINEANFSGQHDAPFLLSISSGQVAEYLNRSVRLDLIDTALSRAEEDRKRINRELKAADLQVQNSEKAFKNLEWVPIAIELEATLRGMAAHQEKLAFEVSAMGVLLDGVAKVDVDLKKQKASLEKHEALFVRLESLMMKGQRTQQDVVLLTEKLDALEAQEKAVMERATMISEVSGLMDTLHALLMQWTPCSQFVGDLATMLDDVDRADLNLEDCRDKGDPDRIGRMLVDLEPLLARHRELVPRKNRLEDLLDDMTPQQVTIRKLEQELMVQEMDLDKDTEGLCPVCHTPMEDHSGVSVH